MATFRLFQLRRRVADSLRSNSRSEKDEIVLKAVSEANTELVKTFLQKSDHPFNIRDDDRRTVLHIAAMEGHLDLLNILLADPRVLKRINAHDRANRTSLHLAAAMGFESCLQALVDHKATIDCLDEEGRTPLHLAIRFSWPEAVKSLLALKANPSIEDAYGYDAVDLSKQSQDGEVSALMMSFGQTKGKGGILSCFSRRRREHSSPPGQGPQRMYERGGADHMTSDQEQRCCDLQDAFASAGAGGAKEEQPRQADEETDAVTLALAQAAREHMQLNAGQPAGEAARQPPAPAEAQAGGADGHPVGQGPPEAEPQGAAAAAVAAAPGPATAAGSAALGGGSGGAAAATAAAPALEGDPTAAGRLAVVEPPAEASGTSEPKAVAPAPEPAVYEPPPCTAVFLCRAHFCSDVKRLGFEVAWKEEGPSLGPVVPDGAADQLGLKQGDFISEINGVSTSGKGRADLLPLMTSRPLLLDINRLAEALDGQRQPHIQLSIQVGGTSDDRGFDIGWFGTMPSVCTVRKDSAAWTAGLLEGDGIVMANQCHVAKSSQAAMRAEIQKRPLQLTVWRRPLGEPLATPWALDGQAAHWCDMPAKPARAGDLTDSDGSDGEADGKAK